MRVKEGYMLIYDNLVWTVKGCFHPEGYAVALPRVAEGKKIKKMYESMDFVRKRYPNILKYLPELGLEVPLVPLDKSIVLDPYSKKIFNNELVLEFISLFNNVGITGSYLYSDSGKDIDLLTEDEENYEKLVELRKRGITKPIESISEEEVEVIDSMEFLNLKKRRVLEGVYKGVPYTFKIVNCVKFEKVREKRKFEGTVKITEAIKPYSLPVIYYTDNGFYLTSFRIRFTELNEGIILRIKGEVFVRENIIELPLDHAEYVKILKI